MNIFMLAQSNIPLLGPLIDLIAKGLGFVMEGLYYLFATMGVESIALAIIAFTIIVRVCMIPLFAKQQKFTRISQIMNPEIQAIQKKYQNKRDNDSMMAMQAETKAVYQKYGTSPSGSCLQLVIQLPILWAVYLIIRNVPAYVPTLKVQFLKIIAGLPSGFISNTVLKSIKVTEAMSTTEVTNNAVAVMATYEPSQWEAVQNAFTGDASVFNAAHDAISSVYALGNMDLSISAWTMMKSGIIIAVLFPILAAVTQWISIQLSMARTKRYKSVSQQVAANQADPMQSSMKTMNLIMPLFSLWICFTLPAGVAMYWSVGTVVQIFIQWAVNKKLDKDGVEKLIEKNRAKAEAKRKKKKDYVEARTIAAGAQMNTKKLSNAAAAVNKANAATTDNKNRQFKEGSLAAKANLVNQYNERNAKGGKNGNK